MKVTIEDPTQLTVAQLQAALADHVPPSEMPKKKDDLVALAELHLADRPEPEPATGAQVPQDRPDAVVEHGTGRPIADSPDATAAAVPVDETTAPIEVWRGTAEAAEMEPYRPQMLPSRDTWAQLWEYATDLQKGMTLPPALRGRPADIVLVLLAGRDIGVSMTEAINKIHIIDGRPSQAAELMRGLIVDRGHEMRRIEFADEFSPPEKQTEWRRHVSAAAHAGVDPRCAVTMIYRRKDWPAGTDATCTWTLEMAKQAELITAYDDTGRVTASKKDNWRHYPRAMLTARATSEAAKNDFPDVLAGVSYTPDELGAETDEYGAPRFVPSDQATGGPVDELLDEATVAELQSRLDMLSDELRDEVRGVWKRQMFPPMSKLTTAHLGPINAIIEAREKRMPEDADVIDCEGDEVSSESTTVDDVVDAAAVTSPADTVCPDCKVALDVDPVEHGNGCKYAPF